MDKVTQFAKKIGVSRVAQKFGRDFLITFAGFVTADGFEPSTDKVLGAAGVAVGLAVYRILRDLGVVDLVTTPAKKVIAPTE